MNANINLGDKVSDPITGFTGIAIARQEFLHCCPRIAIESSNLKDGTPVDPQWFDEPRLKLLEPKAYVPTTLTAGSTARASVGR